jgi:steroid 5-alpha reductase family enzyme
MAFLISYYLIGVLLFFTGCFFISRRFKNYGLVDIAWGLGFVLIVLLSFKLNPEKSGSEYLLGTCVFLWGVRLSAFLFIRNFSKPEDFRYREMRRSWGSSANIQAFFKIFLLQGVLIIVIGSPIILRLNSPPSQLGFFQLLGFLLWGFGFFWESWADNEKMKFKKIEGNSDRPCTIGPYKYSQYANYFGEIILWWGLYLISLPHQYFYITLISPVLISFLILKVSGIPLLEKKNKDQPSYADYRKKTNIIFPGRPKDL